MEKLIVRAFKRWCRDNLESGEKPCGEHAVMFFVSLGASGREDWARVHAVLSDAGLIGTEP